MRTKIIDGTFHLKRRMKIYFEGKIRPLKQISGKLRIIEDKGTTYVVLSANFKRFDDGFMIPIIEYYDSLEE